jgi:hypothetical protein
MNQVSEVTAKETTARWEAWQDWKEVGEFNLNKYPAGTLERSSYLAEAHKIAHENGELL